MRGASLPRVASSANTGAEAHDGVISPSSYPSASTVVTARLEASKAPRRTSRGQSRISGYPLGGGVAGTPALAPPACCEAHTIGASHSSFPVPDMWVTTSVGHFGQSPENPDMVPSSQTPPISLAARGEKGSNPTQRRIGSAMVHLWCVSVVHLEFLR